MATVLELARTSQPETFRYQSSEAFPIHLVNRDISPSLLKDLVVSYLGEYRYQLGKYNFQYLLHQEKNNTTILDMDGNHIVEIAYRGVKKKKERGQSTSKEEADVIGAIKLEKILHTMLETDTVIWASPFDAQAGYTYGFMYTGKIGLDKDRPIFSITAIRIEPLSEYTSEKEELTRYNQAFSFLSSLPVQFETPNEFITNPLVIQKILTESEIDWVLGVLFGRAFDPQEQTKFNSIISKMNAHIEEFIHLFKIGEKLDDLQRVFYALENYFIFLKEAQENTSFKGNFEIPIYPVPRSNPGDEINGHGFLAFVDEFGRKRPPQVMGSCGSTSSPDIFGFDSGFRPAWEGVLEKITGDTTLTNFEFSGTYSFDHTGTCKVCEGENKRLGPCDICEECDRKLA